MSELPPKPPFDDELIDRVLEWVSRGLLVNANPDAAKQHRRYTRPERSAAEPLFSRQLGKQSEQAM